MARYCNIIFAYLAIILSLIEQIAVHNTGLVSEREDPLLIFSTISGSLIGVSQRTGEIRWKQNDEPAVKVPQSMSDSALPMFLPDPKDGSLYLFGIDSEALKKLPFTIPQLVASSPCRSSDGILYTGRKIDTWFSIDPKTGEKEQLFGFDKGENTCPLKSEDVLFIGRTEYNIIMIDSKHKDKKWNVTFYDYSASKMDPDVNNNYEFVHFTASSSGRVVTIDRLGKAIWEIDLESPVVAAYTASKDTLMTVPFRSVSDETLNRLIDRISSKPSDIKLYPTLYIGEHGHGLYALPSLVDSSTATITGKSVRLLIEGPLVTEKSHENTPESNDHIQITSSDVINENNQDFDKSIIVIGHYKIPDENEFRKQNQPLLLTGRSDPVIQNKKVTINSTRVTFGIKSNHTTNATSSPKSMSQWLYECKDWINQQENKGLKIACVTSVALMIWMFWYFNVRFKEFQQLSQKFDQNSRESSRNSSNGRNGFIYAAEDVGEGLVRVGKIIFSTDEVLGKGCDGTIVYKGEFDGRSVAVKRLLPDCFTFADREVALLRESDAHENVVRYFCTEQDKLFRYIALELAEATLQDYVAGGYNRDKISIKNILKQATSGLAHLHLLDIVHRDIKPHNVLLSMPGSNGEIRAMISDFGLCKKLQRGRDSFSRRSGITGTDGWIAPEMLNGDRTTCAVDIFSLGCVFYYVLSGGKHPFGDALRRQANILHGNTDLSHLKNMTANDEVSALLLIKAMIASNPTNRPPASAVLNYPIFWTPSQILIFFLDVSDRVEKEGPESPELIALEKGNWRIVQRDWRLHIDPEVASDLRKYRSYRGDNVRDLLRALRNKKNHYRELTPAAQKSLGRIPDEFIQYWLTRFPYLLTHVYCAMQQFRAEVTLGGYYHSNYLFMTEEPDEGDKPDDTSVVSVIIPSKIEENTVDWSPNRLKNRGPKRRFYQSKKPKESIAFKETPTNQSSVN